MDNKYEFALMLIGANILLYNHFDTYMIPNDNGSGIFTVQNSELFLQMIEKYYKTKNMLNRDYGIDLDEQNKTKKFIIKYANKYKDETFQKGVDWVKHNLT